MKAASAAAKTLSTPARALATTGQGVRVLAGAAAGAGIKLGPPTAKGIAVAVVMMSTIEKGTPKEGSASAQGSGTKAAPTQDVAPQKPAGKRPTTTQGTAGSVSREGRLGEMPSLQTTPSTPQSGAQPVKEVAWSAHGGKHGASSRTLWSTVVKGTKTGAAKYLPGTSIEALERLAWAQGTPVTTGKPWKVMEFSAEIGASGGKSSRWVRIEESAGTIHGHPITLEEFQKLKRQEIDWRSGRVVFWELDLVDASRPLADQLDGLKEDLAQVEYPGGIVLDVGWYPEFSKEGEFVVTLVKNADWDRPLMQHRCATINALQRSIDIATVFAEESTKKEPRE
jgi:hypothetical protein